MRDAKELNGIDGMEYLASMPKGEEVVNMVVHNGVLYVSTSKHIYKLKDERRLERIPDSGA